jgi:hypothetical protein
MKSYVPAWLTATQLPRRSWLRSLIRRAVSSFRVLPCLSAGRTGKTAVSVLVFVLLSLYVTQLNYTSRAHYSLVTKIFDWSVADVILGEVVYASGPSN